MKKANIRKAFLSIFELGGHPSCSNSEKKITYIWQLVILRENQQELLATKKSNMNLTPTCFHRKRFIGLNDQNYSVEKYYKQNTDTEYFRLCQLVDKHSELSSVFKRLGNMLMGLASLHGLSMGLFS